MDSEHLDPRGLRRLLDAVTSVTSDLELAVVLRKVVEAAVDLVGARYGALGVLDERGEQLAEFITVGLDEADRSRIGHLPKGLGLLGSLIRDAKPLRLAELTDHADSVGFPPNHPPMRSFLGVPVRVRGDVFGNLYLADKVGSGTFSDSDEALALSLASAAGVAIDNARLFAQVLQREAALAAMQEVAGAVLSGLGRAQSLDLIARHARVLLHAELATVALPQPDGVSLAIEVVDGSLAQGDIGDRFPIAGTISGEVLQHGETIVLEDASSDHRSRQPQVQGGLIGPAVWTPLTAGGRPFGTLAVCRSTGRPPFNAADLDMVRSFAAQASVVLDRDRARRDRQRLAVLEDQERIARDLHDSVIQRLFATGMSLHGASRMIDDPMALQRVTAAVDDLDVTIRHIRTVIFGLEDARHDRGSGVRSSVLELTREAGRILGSEPQVTFDGPVDAVVDDTTAEALLAVLREAISNVVHHAGAGRVSVEVGVRDRTLTLQVADDGVGITEEAARNSGGHGLRNMRTRAERLGGGLELETVPEGGALLRWHVPVSG
ncbi:GAF domain-containing protein [Acidiferrimicrobium sp. IK]|uniref:sensor histidine kinase n=1 Tax=Acidiferrimicrobium sp. IK TaxID=2871700 RepID=UPI0021CB2530|nr:GAF domain-containing protein [Acidiferrimicrobium sp. IK]MCU4182860.1 GAF domain-containing protein [Acidiferrimicrobium sp. IK]